MLKLISFDWDDVFTTGSTDAYHACYVKAARDAGAKTSEAEIIKVVDELWGRPHETVIHTYLAHEEALFDTVNANYETNIHTDVFLNNLKLVDGSLEMLSRLSEEYTLAIVSGINPTLLKEQIFQKFRVPNVFSAVLTSSELDDKSRGKPHPDMLNMVLSSLHIRPAEAVHVGDAPGDVLMAQGAGVTPIVVLTGQLTRDEAIELGVQYIVDDITSVEKLIRGEFIK